MALRYTPINGAAPEPALPSPPFLMQTPIRAAPEVGQRNRPATISAADLLRRDFPPIKWVVPGLIPEGLTLLVGSPKTGKSWMALDIALAIASGSSCLGDLACEQGEVLYLALEDNQRRLQRRLNKLLGAGSAAPSGLILATEWRLAHEGGLDHVRDWLDEADNPRLVIIDVLQKFRQPGGANQLYQADFQAIGGLQQLAGQYGIAIVVVHHTRKGGAGDDPFELVSGTQALAGAADTTMVLSRTSNGVTLYARGRDIEEVEKAVEFDRASCRWKILGEAAEHHRSDQRVAVINALRSSDSPMTSKKIALATEMPDQNVRQLLGKMVTAGEISKLGRGLYGLPVVTGDAAPYPHHNDHNDHIGDVESIEAEESEDG